MGGKTYEGRFLREISFPLGGIGADSIGLAGNGRLIDWYPRRRRIIAKTNRTKNDEDDEYKVTYG